MRLKHRLCDPTMTCLDDGSFSACSGDDPTTFYLDADSDGYARETDAEEGCERPSQDHYTETELAGDDPDCDDSDPDINPGAAEDCTTTYDDNCNGEANEGCSTDACEDQGAFECRSPDSAQNCTPQSDETLRWESQACWYCFDQSAAATDAPDGCYQACPEGRLCGDNEACELDDGTPGQRLQTEAALQASAPQQGRGHLCFPRRGKCPV